MSNAKATAVMQEVNSLFKGTPIKMASDKTLKVEYLPTGFLPIDILLQGGLPRGRFVEFYGDYSTLKSYIGLAAIATTQKAGGVCAIIDTEHAFDPKWAEQSGVDLASLIVIQPLTGEMAMDSVESLLTQNVDLIIFDSIAATLPQAERNRRLHDESIQMARLASLMSIAMRKLTSANSKTAILWINQTRMNVGITFGNPETTPGGKAMPFYASYRINMKKVGKVTEDIMYWDGEAWVKGKSQTAQKYRAIVDKSKLSAPFRDSYFTWDLKTGQIDEIGFLIGQGLEAGFITQEGKKANVWCYGKVKVLGREKFKTALSKDEASLKSLKESVMDLHGISHGKEKQSTVHKSKVAVKKKSISRKTK